MAPTSASSAPPDPSAIAGPAQAGKPAGTVFVSVAASTSRSAGGCGFGDGGGAAGGGQVTSPSWITVAPRMTTSSISTASTPSFSGQSSASRFLRLVA